MPRILKNNGLTIVLMSLFLASAIGHWLTGWYVENEELKRHGEAGIGLVQYLADPDFVSTLFENWESEFLQMSAYVVLTAVFIQKGSAESKDPDGPARDHDLEAQGRKKDAPGALRAGGFVRSIYARSLGLTLFALFLASFVLHWVNSARNAAEEAEMHGNEGESVGAYLMSPELWFESFQNWQSEFFATAVLVVLSIWLRQRESPESKPVAAPHSQTGA